MEDNLTLNVDYEQLRELEQIIKYEEQFPAESTHYFEFLKKYKANEDIHIISDISFKSLYNVKANYYYSMISFKTYMCELFYRAINMFPDIIEYTMHVKNDKVSTAFIISSILTDSFDDNGQRALALITNEFETYILSKYDINNLYTANRTSNNRCEAAVALVMLLWRDGCEPSVTTSYKLHPKFIKNCKKM